MPCCSWIQMSFWWMHWWAAGTESSGRPFGSNNPKRSPLGLVLLIVEVHSRNSRLGTLVAEHRGLDLFFSLLLQNSNSKSHWLHIHDAIANVMLMLNARRTKQSRLAPLKCFNLAQIWLKVSIKRLRAPINASENLLKSDRGLLN